MNALADFGLGDDDLVPQVEHVDYPPAVPGRVAHIDADFLAYQVSAETRDELDGIKPRKSLEQMQHNAREAAEHLMRSAGATSYVCHITPSGSDKGGRAAQAVQQQYQASRKERERPEFLDAIRAYIVAEMHGIAHLDQEADDGMAQANYNARGPGGEWAESNLSIIVSRDKDLRMVPGLHYDFDTNSIFCVGDAFGSVWLDDSKKATKLRGWGTAFFWAQCLMGDTADCIKGIPKIVDDFGKLKPCGPVAAWKLLNGVHNDREAFAVVKQEFVKLGEAGYEFKHWQTGEVVTPTQALLGDMRLLWMRRDKNPDDVIVWLKEKLA